MRFLFAFSLVLAPFLTSSLNISAHTDEVASNIYHVNSALVSGVNVAVTQHFFDYALSVGLPFGLDFLRNLHFPDPFITGDDDSLSWKVGNVQLSNLNAGAEIGLSEPSTIALAITDLQFGLSASVSAREDIWPHPHDSGGATAISVGSGAVVALSLHTNSAGVLFVNMDSCNAHVSLANLKLNGLGILDPIANLIIGEFKGKIESAIGEAVCKNGVQDALVTGFLNPLLKGFKYQLPLPLPAPWNKAIVDLHAVGAAVTKNDTDLYIEAGTVGEVFTADGRHSPYKAVKLPTLKAATLGSHMVSSQVGPFPFNSLMWTFWAEKLLQQTVTPADLPSLISTLLSTEYYKDLVPGLYTAYPHANLTMLINVTEAPLVTLGAAVTAAVNVSFDYSILAANGSTIPAFTVWAPLDVPCTVGTTGNSITGSIGKLKIDLHAGASHFGNFMPGALTTMSASIGGLLDYLVIPGVNKFLAKGFPLPSIKAAVGASVLSLSFVNPAIHLDDGFIVVGTDAKATLKPK